LASSFASSPPTPEEGASNRQLADFIERAIDELPEAYRVVFVLRAVEQLSVAETAASLEIPEETVKTRFFRGRALLREELERRIAGEASKVFGFDGTRCDRIVNRVLTRIGVAR
jgi:RNA polymerase sigma-70 factor (ECF subfamily)